MERRMFTRRLRHQKKSSDYLSIPHRRKDFAYLQGSTPPPPLDDDRDSETRAVSVPP